MAVKIDSALTINDYQRITEALRNEWKVIILDEQKLESPMTLLDPVYVSAKKNGGYSLDSKVYLDSTKAASTVQVCARKNSRSDMMLSEATMISP